MRKIPIKMTGLIHGKDVKPSIALGILFHQFNTNQLIKILKQRGIPVPKTKDEMVERLIRYYNDDGIEFSVEIADNH